MSPQTVLAIVGPTASGKTALALQVAGKYNGEIICADSRTVYRGMDLGTAKPTAQEQEVVVHHLLDVVSPDQGFSVADFQHLARQALASIHTRGKLAVVVGGTGLYVDSVMYDFKLRPLASKEEQEELTAMTDDQLRQKLDELGLALNQSDRLNRRRLERAVSAGLSITERSNLPNNHYIVGLNPGIEVLEQRIAERTKQWFKNNILEETAVLETTFGRIEPLNTSPYREIAAYLENGGDLVQTEVLINLHLRQIARRQLTWFKRNPDISWAATPQQGLKQVNTVLG